MKTADRLDGEDASKGTGRETGQGSATDKSQGRGKEGVVKGA